MRITPRKSTTQA